MVKLDGKGIVPTAVLAIVVVIAIVAVAGYLVTKPAGTYAPALSPTPPLNYGVFYFAVTDRPNAIGDFAALNVTVSKIGVHSAKDNLENIWLEFTPSTSTFDLVTLQGDNIQTLVSTFLPIGKYTQVRLIVVNAVGILKTGGTENVTVPSGELKLVQSFQIEENKTTTFVFDLNVVKTGDNAYMLTPVAGKVTTQ